jgi:hypothetical protein
MSAKGVRSALIFRIGAAATHREGAAFMSALMWQFVRAGAVIAALPYLFLRMEWSEDRLAPDAAPATLQDVIASAPTAPDGPIQAAVASPIVMPRAASACAVTPVELSPLLGKSVARAKRKSTAPTSTRPSKPRHFLQVVVAERGSKEVKH